VDIVVSLTLGIPSYGQPTDPSKTSKKLSAFTKRLQDIEGQVRQPYVFGTIEHGDLSSKVSAMTVQAERQWEITRTSKERTEAWNASSMIAVANISDASEGT